MIETPPRTARYQTAEGRKAGIAAITTSTRRRPAFRQSLALFVIGGLILVGDIIYACVIVSGLHDLSLSPLIWAYAAGCSLMICAAIRTILDQRKLRCKSCSKTASVTLYCPDCGVEAPVPELLLKGGKAIGAPADEAEEKLLSIEDGDIDSPPDYPDQKWPVPKLAKSASSRRGAYMLWVGYSVSFFGMGAATWLPEWLDGEISENWMAVIRIAGFAVYLGGILMNILRIRSAKCTNCKTVILGFKFCTACGLFNPVGGYEEPVAKEETVKENILA